MTAKKPLSSGTNSHRVISNDRALAPASTATPMPKVKPAAPAPTPTPTAQKGNKSQS